MTEEEKLNSYKNSTSLPQQKIIYDCQKEEKLV